MAICYNLRAGTVRHLQLPLRKEFCFIQAQLQTELISVKRLGFLALYAALCKFECEKIASILSLIIYNYSTDSTILKIEIKGSGSICIKGFNKIIPRVGYA